MLSSLDALAEKISPGSGKNSPNQQQSPHGADSLGTAITPTNTSGAASTTGYIAKTHFSQSIHPYQKSEHISNNNREKWVQHCNCFHSLAAKDRIPSDIVNENLEFHPAKRIYREQLHTLLSVIIQLKRFAYARPFFCAIHHTKV